MVCSDILKHLGALNLFRLIQAYGSIWKLKVYGYNFCVTILKWPMVSNQEKIINLCESNLQLLSVCKIKIVVKIMAEKLWS